MERIIRPIIDRRKKTVRFYDNEEHHIVAIQEMCEHIDAIYVKDVILFPPGIAYPANYADTEERSTYVLSVLEERDRFGIPSGEPYGAVVGIAPEHMEELLLWSDENPLEKVVLLDWDRTLSIVEGMISPPAGSKYADFGIDYESVIRYVCGGKTRVNYLKKHLSAVADKGVEIFILTNNPICDQNKPEFLELIKLLIPTMDLDHIVCSGAKNAAGINIYRNKAEFLRANPIFSEDRFIGARGRWAC